MARRRDGDVRVLLIAVTAAEVLRWASIGGTPWLTRGIGATVALLGVALRQWATLTLGRLFTQRVMVREGRPWFPQARTASFVILATWERC